MKTFLNYINEQINYDSELIEIRNSLFNDLKKEFNIKSGGVSGDFYLDVFAKTRRKQRYILLSIVRSSLKNKKDELIKFISSQLDKMNKKYNVEVKNHTEHILHDGPGQRTVGTNRMEIFFYID